MADSAKRPVLLVVEDDIGLQKQLRWCFEQYEVVVAADRPSAIAALRRYEPAVVLQDLGLPPDPAGVAEGMACISDMLSLRPRIKVIVMTGNHDRDNAVRAVGAGAYDFYQKPLDVATLQLIVARAFHISVLEAENEQLRLAQLSSPLEGVVGCDAAIQKLCRTVEKIAPADVSVLVRGESGTGKELIARALHRLSPRRTQRFMAINCAAIPEQLLESELFGYEKGAFTGAVKTTPGKIEVASGGTLFLDEIGDMPLALQAKLLRFLQHRIVERLGGRQEIPVDVRVVCATNQDLEAHIEKGLFRRDLYYRIGEITLSIPPLRERPGDIVAIAHALLRGLGSGSDTGKKGFTADALAAMTAHPWPGNVRELENKLKSAVFIADGPMINAADLGLAAQDAPGQALNLKEVRARAERQAVLQALQATDSNLSRAADLLGVTRPTLYDLLQRLSIDVPNREPSEPAAVPPEV
jgi:two-component system, NtrC family, response regulator